MMKNQFLKFYKAENSYSLLISIFHINKHIRPKNHFLCFFTTNKREKSYITRCITGFDK